MPNSATPNKRKPRYESHLFTLRVWLEQRADGGKEWHGKVQNVATGNARYFREWSALVAYLEQTIKANYPIE